MLFAQLIDLLSPPHRVAKSFFPMKLEFLPYETGVSYLWYCSFIRMKLEFPTYETKISWGERLTKSAIYATFV